MSDDFNKKNKDFIDRVSKLNAGDLAVLRRNVDNPLENIKALPVLARIGAIDSFYRSLIACLYAIYHRENDTPYYVEDFNFGHAYCSFMRSDNKDFKPEEHDKRFKILISSDKEDLPFRLRQAVKQIKSKNEKIDFSVLLIDLYNWEKEDRRTQRKWVKGFYNIFEKEDEENINLNNEGDDL